MKRFRLYYDKDAEQDWLNGMADRGWAFSGFFLGVYSFEKCEPGEWRYQIDLLPARTDSGPDYAAFMSDSGVEVVSRWFLWVYLRKKAVEGPFEMYTDVESKIAQYVRIRRFFYAFAAIEAALCLVELNSAIRLQNAVFGAFTVLLGVIAAALFRIAWKCSWKIGELEKGRPV